MIIHRKEINTLKKIKGWTLVYGRRKTGKTFLVKNFVKYDEYFFVKRDGQIISEDHNISYGSFKELLSRSIDANKTIVVDEFHRLPEDFLDYLHYYTKKGKVILISSTLYLAQKLVSQKSPILGIFAEFPVNIIDLKDSLLELKDKIQNKKELVETAILLREPLLIPFYSEGERARKLMANVIDLMKLMVPALVGEIFTEEDRKISGIYEGVLRAIARGKSVSSEISSFLFSNKMLKKDDPSIVQQYLVNLMNFGLIRRLDVFNRKYYHYKVSSPLIYFYYYLDEKYNFSEKSIGELNTRKVIDEIYPHAVENNIRQFLAGYFGLAESKIETKDYDVDACLLKFKKPNVAVEIKWKDKIPQRDIRRAEDILNMVKCKRKILFVPDKKKVQGDTSLEVLDIYDFL